MAVETMHGATGQSDTAEDSSLASKGRGRCPRCGGFMVEERYIDLLDDTGQLEFTADRCVQCGEVVDSTILKNRQANQSRTMPTRLAQVA